VWSPLRLVPLLERIVHLQEEQNALLRELQVALTGRQPLTLSRRTTNASDTRTKSAAVYWQRKPLTVSEQQARANADRELAARPPENASAAPPLNWPPT